MSDETVRRWALKFGAIFARKLRPGRPRPDVRWHLDEVLISINGRQLYVWRAVDSEGEVLDILVQPRRDRKAVLKLMRTLKKYGVTPATIVTDKLDPTARHCANLVLRGDTTRVAGRITGQRIPSAIATTRTTDEALQVPRVGTALSLNPRRRLQCVQRPTPSISRRTLRSFRAQAMLTWRHATVAA